MIAFGAKVRALRVALGMSQEQLANQCDIATSHMSKIENGKTDTRLSNIERIAKALNVKVSELMDF